MKRIGVDDVFRYLGADFTPNGLCKTNITELQTKIDVLLKTPAKPQQKLFMLKNFLLPTFYHKLIFSKQYASYLKKIDIIVRKTVRKVLRLPHDLPKATFHAKVADGGMGVPSLRYLIPFIATKRLKYCPPQENLIIINGKRITSKEQINSYFRKELYRSVDGQGMKESPKCPSAHRWVDNGSGFLRGKDFVKSVHLRYGVLYSKSRSARGREKDKNCRRGCGMVETLNHVLQTCYSTHFCRVKRHDNLVNYIRRIVHDRGITAHHEPKFKVVNSTLKPDLVLYTQDRVHVLDIQVVNDQFSLQTAHINKRSKYECLRSQLEGLRPGGFRCDTLTVNRRGVVAESSSKELTAFGILKRSDFKVISSRAILCGVMTHATFQRMTTSGRRVKKGVG